MVNTLAKDVVELFKIPNNEIYVDADKITFAINSRIFNTNLISPEIFKEKTLDQAKKIITDVLNLTIDKRVELLGDQARNILKDILIQNLDFQ
jgi:hypothetical protein